MNRDSGGSQSFRTPVSIAVGVALIAIALCVAPATAAGGHIYVVDTIADAPAAVPFSKQCRTASGLCSLRAAIQAANNWPGSTIVIPKGHYLLTIPPNPLNTNGPLIDPTTGDLDITAPTTIRGAGQGMTVIDGNRLDRVFMITAETTLSDMTVTNGAAAEHEIPFYDTGGGAILNSAQLRIDHVTLSNSTANFAGGIQNLPWSDFTMSHSIVTGNIAGETGGVRCDNTCNISDSDITNNRAINSHKWYLPASQQGRSGGLGLRGFADVHIARTRIIGNTTTDSGAGIQIGPGYSDVVDVIGTVHDPALAHLYIQDSEIAQNFAGGRSANCAYSFAQIISQGGNSASDRSCNLDHAGDRILAAHN